MMNDPYFSTRNIQLPEIYKQFNKSSCHYNLCCFPLEFSLFFFFFAAAKKKEEKEGG